MKTEFKLPHMVLCRADLEERFTKTEIEQISDDTMQ